MKIVRDKSKVIHWEDLSYDEEKINKILDEIDFKKEYECIWIKDKPELK